MMIKKTLLFIPIVLMSACAPQVVCEPCTEAARKALTPHERGQLALRQDPPDLEKVPFRSQEFKAIWGADDSFCAGLSELTPEAVRKRLIETGQDVTPAIGLTRLMLCEDYYNEDRAATLTRYRLQTYLLLRIQDEEEDEEFVEALRFVAMSGYWEGSTVLDKSNSASLLKKYGWEGMEHHTKLDANSIESHVRRAVKLTTQEWDTGEFKEND